MASLILGTVHARITDAAISTIHSTCHGYGVPPKISFLRNLRNGYFYAPMRFTAEKFGEAGELLAKINPTICGYSTETVAHVVLNAFNEELFHRFWIQGVLLPLFGNLIGKVVPVPVKNILNHPATRIAITSLLFAAGHDVTWLCMGYAINFFAFGIIDGMIYEKGGLIPATIEHAVHNFYFLWLL